MFDECLYFNTTSLARKLERIWGSAFSTFGLTPAQAFLLRVVLNRPGCHQIDLAKEMNITPATASRTLDGLVKLGFIKRQGSSQDGRGTHIYPTDQAIAIFDELNTASSEVTQQFKILMGTEEFSNLVFRLKKISTALD